MPFFEFSQNNSGGGFDFDAESGISHWVIVEAASARQANTIAEDIGLYFDGRGDCPCCGDRWYRAYDEGDSVPSVYGEPYDQIKFGPFPLQTKWIDGPEGYIHYADGRVVGFGE